MGSDQKVLLRVGEEQVAWFQAHHGRAVPLGAWLQVSGKVSANELSTQLKATVVELFLSTVIDEIWIQCWVRGALKRELHFHQGRWAKKTGEPLPFENDTELSSWLRKRKLLASPDGYAVLDAFLGAPHSDGPSVIAELLSNDTTPEAVAHFPQVLAARQQAVDAERARRQALNQRRVLVLAGPRQIRMLTEAMLSVRPRAWVPYEGKQTIEELSHLVDGLVVELKFSGLEQTLVARAADHGRVVREVGFYSWQGWMARVGASQPFEDEEAMARVQSSVPEDVAPHIDTFFAAFLGKNETHPSAVTLFDLTGEPRHRVW